MWRCLLQRLLPIALATAGFSASVPTAAQAPDPWNRPIVFQAKDEPIESVLVEIGSTTKTSIELTQAAREALGKQRVTVSVDNVPLRNVIEAVARVTVANGKRLSVSFNGKHCTVDLAEAPPLVKPAAAATGPDHRLVTYQGDKVTLLKAVTELLDGVKVGYRIHPEIREAMRSKRANLKFESLELRNALGLIVRELPPPTEVYTWYEPESEYYVFMPVPKDTGSRDAVATLSESGDRRLSASFKNVDIRYAVKALFTATHDNYTVDSRVVGTVTGDIRDLLLRDALTRVLQMAKSPLTYGYKQVNGVFMVTPNKDYEKWK